MKLYLSSYKVGNETEELKKWINEHGNKICLIPNARDVYPESEEKTNKINADKQELLDLGFDVEIVDLKDYFENKENLPDKMKEFSGCYIIGGNVFALRQAMYLSGFDKYIDSVKDNPNFLYAGYSAGVCVLSKDMHGYDMCDDPSINPYGIDTLWEGLGYYNYLFLPHYKSNHKETSFVDQIVEHCDKNNIKYKTLTDGDVIVKDYEDELER